MRIEQYLGVVLLVLGACGLARAQPVANTTSADPAPLADVSALMRCVANETIEMDRLRNLALAAERQNRQASDAAARADARTAVESLKRQIWARQEQIALCFANHRPIPFSGSDTASTTTNSTSGSTDERVARAGSSLHAVDSERSLGNGLRVLRGVRIDGVEGAVPDDAVRTAIDGLAPTMESCVRGSTQVPGSQLVLEFEVSSSGRVLTVQTVERVGSSQETARCFETALRSMSVPLVRGRSAFSYTFGLGPN